MSQSNEITAMSINTTNAASTTTSPAKTLPVVATSHNSTKDAGRVHVGGGMMRF